MINSSEQGSEPDTSKILFSEDFDDPVLGQVLTRHLQECSSCQPFNPSPAFGISDRRYCPEYYEIIQEYSDYERDYVAKGNP